MIKNIYTKQQFALATCAVLAALAFLTFIFAIWQWRSDWVLAHQATAPANVTASNEKAEMIGALPKAHLFGMAIENDGQLPISNLQLRVTGIVKVDSEQSGSVSKAYISIQGQPSKIYQIGDELPYGVKVYQINNDAVVLENDGHLEQLPLPREELEFKPRNTEESN